MAVCLSGLPGQPAFDTVGEPATLAQRWKTWKVEFELYVVASGVTDPTQQRALLLHLADPAVRDIFKSFADEDKGGAKDYNKTIDCLSDYFKVKKKTARIAALEGKTVREEVQKGVRAYRATKQPTTGASPNKLMFGWELRGKFPEGSKRPEPMDDENVRYRDKEKKAKMKQYADKRRHTAVMIIKLGDQVLCKQSGNTALHPYMTNDCHWRQRENDHSQKLGKDKNHELRRLEAAQMRNPGIAGPRGIGRGGRYNIDTGYMPEEGVPRDTRSEPERRPEQEEVDTQQTPMTSDRPRRKITSTRDTKYRDVLCLLLAAKITTRDINIETLFITSN